MLSPPCRNLKGTTDIMARQLWRANTWFSQTKDANMSDGIQPHDFWCENCKLPTHLDVHLRCATCGSDQVATRHRPDARSSMGRALYAMAAEAIAKMEAK